MPTSEDDISNIKKNRRRERRKSLLLLLLAGLLVFATVSVGLYFVLRPVTLRIAVGPLGSDDQKLIQAMARTFDRDGSAVRLSPIITDGAAQSLALLGASRADIAVARDDLDMPSDAEAVVIVRKNVVVLWSPSGLPGRGSKKQPIPKIKTIDELEGHRVGVIGKTPANIALLRVILVESGVNPDKVTVTQFGANEIEELARDPKLDAFMAVGPVDSKVTMNAIAATARVRGGPVFIPVDVSETIALKHPLVESEEIPGGIFNAKPAWPDDKVETVSVTHLLVARKSLSESTVATLARQALTVRQELAREVPGAAHIKKPDVEKDALPVHRGVVAYINGTERTFLDRYSDYFWFSILLLSGLGSAGAWLQQFMKRGEEEEIVDLRNRIKATIPRVRDAPSVADLPAIQGEVDTIIRETLDCYDDGGLDEEDLAAFSLELELFEHAVVNRRARNTTDDPHPAK
jgi:TRAP-type uncharacterized transport system substrate-binding protein